MENSSYVCFKRAKIIHRNEKLRLHLINVNQSAELPCGGEVILYLLPDLVSGTFLAE